MLNRKTASRRSTKVGGPCAERDPGLVSTESGSVRSNGTEVDHADANSGGRASAVARSLRVEQFRHRPPQRVHQKRTNGKRCFRLAGPHGIDSESRSTTLFAQRAVGGNDHIVGVGVGFGVAEVVEKSFHLKQAAQACQYLQVRIGISRQHEEKQVGELPTRATERDPGDRSSEGEQRFAQRFGHAVLRVRNRHAAVEAGGGHVFSLSDRLKNGGGIENLPRSSGHFDQLFQDGRLGSGVQRHFD